MSERLTEERLVEIEYRLKAHVNLPHGDIRVWFTEIRTAWAERDEARYQARCLAARIREYRHMESHLRDLMKELAAGEEACPWLLDDTEPVR